MNEDREFEDLVTAFSVDEGRPSKERRFVKGPSLWCHKCKRGTLITFYWDSLDGRTVFMSFDHRHDGRRVARVGYCPAEPGDWSGAVLAFCPRCDASTLTELEMRPRRVTR